jgi:hypothetical protein
MGLLVIYGPFSEIYPTSKQLTDLITIDIRQLVYNILQTACLKFNNHRTSNSFDVRYLKSNVDSSDVLFIDRLFVAACRRTDMINVWDRPRLAMWKYISSN